MYVLCEVIGGMCAEPRLRPLHRPTPVTVGRAATEHHINLHAQAFDSQLKKREHLKLMQKNIGKWGRHTLSANARTLEARMKKEAEAQVTRTPNDASSHGYTWDQYSIRRFWSHLNDKHSGTHCP